MRGGPRDDTKEKTMTINVIDAATGKSAFVTSGDSERTLLLLLATQNARDIQPRAQEEAAIDAEDILTQAEEANAVEPVG
jgi:hypothetical protein